MDYLKNAEAEKVYAINPIFPALSPDLDSTLSFDTFALLWLKEKPPAEIIDDMVAEGNKVAIRVTFKGTHQGEFLGIAPTGKDVSIPISLIYRLAGGMIVEHWMLADQLGLMQQLGAAPI